MNKYITLSLLSLATLAGHAQDFDTKPTLELGNKEQDVKFTIGARMMTDAAYYHSDFTPMHRLHSHEVGSQAYRCPYTHIDDIPGLVLLCRLWLWKGQV